MPAEDLPEQTDVLVIGAGLAGLACARSLAADGTAVTLIDAADAVGGRVRTDLVGGFRLDRGFQLLNPAYPEVARVIDVAALRMQSFPAAVVVATGGRRLMLADPRRAPQLLPATVKGVLSGRLGGPAELAAFARWAIRSGIGPVHAVLDAEDGPRRAEMIGAGLDGNLRRRVLEPFLAGVLGEDDGSSSARFTRLLIRSFVKAAPGVPWRGMQALPDQLAAGLSSSIRLRVRAEQVTPGWVRTDRGEIRARVVVVATDPVTASQLLDLPAVRMHPLTTFWHVSPELPTRAAALHVDGDRTGPVVNSVVITNTAPSYSPDERSLIASTVLGDSPSAAGERAVLDQLSRMYRTSTTWWELLRTDVIPHALTPMLPPRQVRLPVELAAGLVVAGDHRDTASIQGALVSGRRAADAVRKQLAAAADDRSSPGVA